MAAPEFALPDELRAFLVDGRQLAYDPKKCDCGLVTFLSLPQLQLRKFTILTNEMQHIYGDPHRGEGCYLVPAVDLVASCEDYHPVGILIWIPEEGVFGNWDCDHHVMNVLVARHVRGDNAYKEAATWEDILSDPARYLNAQWCFDAIVSKTLVPWPKFCWTPNVKEAMAAVYAKPGSVLTPR